MDKDEVLKTSLNVAFFLLGRRLEDISKLASNCVKVEVGLHAEQLASS
jgi:hypothetical protein